MHPHLHGWMGLTLRAVGLCALVTQGPAPAALDEVPPPVALDEVPPPEGDESDVCLEDSDSTVQGLRFAIVPDKPVYEEGSKMDLYVGIANKSDRAVTIRECRYGPAYHVCAVGEDWGLRGSGGRRRTEVSTYCIDHDLAPGEDDLDLPIDLSRWLDLEPGTYRVFVIRYVQLPAPDEKHVFPARWQARLRSKEVEITIIPEVLPPPEPSTQAPPLVAQASSPTAQAAASLTEFERYHDPERLRAAAQQLGRLELRTIPRSAELRQVRKDTLELWLKLFALIDASSDRDFSPARVPPSVVLPPRADGGVNYQVPMDPSIIQDPALRRDYERLIAKNGRETRRYHLQTVLLEVDELSKEAFRRFARDTYSQDREGWREFYAAVETLIPVPRRARSLRASLR